MTPSRRVMLLVDADNVSADVIEQAMAAVLDAHGAVHIRRAYCTPESAVKNATLFKRLSLRPMVNLSTGKNATDIALAVDALDLAVAERPDVAVVVSSDSDFAPLVLRLREKGCRVEGIGQQGKTGEASKAVYDSFLDLAHRRAPARSTRAEPAEALAKAPRSRRRAGVADPAASANEPGEAVVDLLLELPPPPPARKAPARRRATREAAATAPVESPPLPDDVQAILKAVPPLASGQPVALGIAAERLRAAGLLARSAASTRLFAKHARHFVLAPQRQPNTVQFITG